MCGLWGYTGRRPANLGILAQAMVVAARRGPDGGGVWCPDASPAVRLWRGAHPSLGDDCRGRQVLGHSRLATTLNSQGIEDFQPCSSGARVYVTHNGSVRNYEAVRESLQLRTRCDSEAIASAVDAEMSQGAGFTTARVRALHVVDLGEHYALAIAVRGHTFLAAHGQSLYALEHGGGTYWCSVQLSPEWEPVNGSRMLRTEDGQQDLQEG